MYQLYSKGPGCLGIDMLGKVAKIGMTRQWRDTCAETIREAVGAQRVELQWHKGGQAVPQNGFGIGSGAQLGGVDTIVAEANGPVQMTRLASKVHRLAARGATHVTLDFDAVLTQAQKLAVGALCARWVGGLLRLVYDVGVAEDMAVVIVPGKNGRQTRVRMGLTVWATNHTTPATTDDLQINWSENRLDGVPAAPPRDAMTTDPVAFWAAMLEGLPEWHGQ